MIPENPEVSAQQAELFQLVVENVKEYAIFVTDERGTVVSWNPGVERLLGYTEEQIVGQPIAVIFTNEDRSAGAPEKEMATAASTGCAEDKRWHQRRDGSRFWANGMVTPLKNDDGTVRGFSKILRDDTAQKLAEERLEESNKRVENILSSIADAFYTLDRDFRYVYVNQATTRMFNLSSDEFLGKTMWELFPHVKGSTFHQEIEEALKTQQPKIFENYYPPFDRWFENRVYPAANGLSVITAEITARKRAESALKFSEEKYRTLFDSIDEGFCIIEMIYDDAGKPIDWLFLETNPAFDKNNSIQNVAGKRITEMAPTIEPKWFEIYGRVAMTGEAERFVEGSEALGIWFDVYAFRIGEPEERKLAVLFTDITAKENAQIEREKLFKSEQEARTEAENANRIKDEFLATLSHELRTPLSSIIGWSKILLSSNIGAEQTRKAIETIDRNAQAQKQLIEDILDVSRIISGKLRLDVRAVDLMEVITAAVETTRPGMEAKDIRLQTLLDPKAGVISGDPDRLQQVVWNLLSNALKFTEKGGRVQIRLERVNSSVELRVSDTGKGIEPEFLPFVFDRFRQSDGSMTRRQGGLGLGLAIVRQIVELHGGTVNVNSEGANQGAAFTVSLPVIPIRQEPESVAPRVHPAVETALSADEDEVQDLSGLQILVVDDEADSRTLLVTLLGLNGAQVTTADSAAEALKIVNQQKFNVIVSDIGMPDEDGFSLIEKIRNLPAEQGGTTPAVALTAYARSEDRIKALRSGFQMHVAKPIEHAELLAVILNLAGRISS